MLINFVDATNDANHYTKSPPMYVWHVWNMYGESLCRLVLSVSLTFIQFGGFVEFTH